MNRKNKNIKRPLLDLEIKLKANKKKGEKVEQRVLFSAGIPQFIRTAKDQPYGEIPLYDDMTEKDVIQIFRAHKKERRRFLAQFGNAKRKYITSNIERDHTWAQMAKRYKRKSYIKIAERWTRMYPKDALSLFASYIWSNPDSIELPELKTFLSNKNKEEFLNHISTLKPTDRFIKDDFDEYIHNRLPKVIRPAVLRYTSASK